MSIVATPSIPLYVSPATRAGLDALSLWLEQNHYSQHAREAVLSHTAREGTPTGSSYLETADEAGATEAFVDALPSVDASSESWDREDVVLDSAMLAEGNHPWPLVQDCDDDRTEDLAAAALEDLAIPPVCGGSEEAEPFEPTAEDLADFGRWSEDLERRREMAEWYARNPLAAFNADRPD
jgi:hypothetical protein